MNNEDFKVVLSDKEYIEKLEKEVHYQNKEVTRLNKLLDETRLSELHKEYIINELEKWLNEDEYFNGRKLRKDYITVLVTDVLDKLKALKENK